MACSSEGKLCYFFPLLHNRISKRYRKFSTENRAPTCTEDEICIPKHVIKPEDIVKHVMAEIDCVQEDCVKESMEQPSESVQFSEQQESAPPNEPSEAAQFSEQQKSVPPI